MTMTNPKRGRVKSRHMQDNEKESGMLLLIRTLIKIKDVKDSN
jgi:hypothetical protein